MIKSHIGTKNIELRLGSEITSYEDRMKLTFPNAYRSTRVFTQVHNDKTQCYKIFALAEVAAKEGTPEQHRLTAAKYLRLANRFAFIQYKLATNLGKDVKFELHDEIFDVRAPKTAPFTTVDYWYKDLAVALILRDEPSIKMLLQYGPKNTANSKGEIAPFDASLCLFIKGIFDSKSDIKKQFGTLMDNVANSPKIPTRQCHIDLCITPIIMAWAALIENNMEKFERNIELATEGIRSYYKDSQWKYDSYGWFPPFLIAACVFAHDQYGYKIRHENPYIPGWLVEGNF